MTPSCLRSSGAVRAPEFAHLPLPAAQLDHLLGIQYAGQKQSYGAQYPGGHHLVLFDGKPIGRIWLFRGERSTSSWTSPCCPNSVTAASAPRS